MKHKNQYERKVMGQKASQSSENEESDYTATETSSMSESFHKKSRRSATQFSVLRSDADGLRMKISAIRRKTNDSRQGGAQKCLDNNNFETLKLKAKEDSTCIKDSMSAPLTVAMPLTLEPKSCGSRFVDESDSRSEASNNGKMKKIKLKRKKAAKLSESRSQLAVENVSKSQTFSAEEKNKNMNEIKESSLAGLNQAQALPDDNIGLSSSDNELPALVDAAIKCVESDSDSHSICTQPKIQYTSTLLQDFMEKTQRLSACAGKAKHNTETATTLVTTNIINGGDPPVKKKRGRPKKIPNNNVNESADSGVVSSAAQSTSPSPKIHLERSRSQAKTERDRDASPPKIDIVNLDKRMYAMNERVLYPPPRSKLRKQSAATKPTHTASSVSNIRLSPNRSNKEDMLDPVWRKIDVNSKFRRPSVSGYKSDCGGGGNTTICSKILTAKSGYASDYGIRSNHYSGYKSDASGKSRCSMRSCYSRVSRAKSCDGKRRSKFRRKRRPTINHSKSVGNLNEQDILQLAGLSLGQSSEESSESAVCKPKILVEEAEASNVYKKYGEINRYVTTGEYFGRSKATNFGGNKQFDNYNPDQGSQDTYTFLGTMGNKLYARSRKSSVTAAELPLQLGSSRKLKSRRSSVASFCSSSFYSGISKSKRRRRRKSMKFGCSKMVVVDSKLLTEIEIITNSFPTMCRIQCDKPVTSSYVKEKIISERVAPQKSTYQYKRNLKKRKLSENVDFALSNGINITTNTSKRRHKKTCSSSPDDHKLPLKKRHYLLTPGEKTEKTHVVGVYATENLKSQKESVEPKASTHVQKTNARTITTRAAVTPKKRHLLQTSVTEGGNNTPNYLNDTKVAAVKNTPTENFPTEVVNNKKRNRLEGLVSKITNASSSTTGDGGVNASSSTDQAVSLPICTGTSFPPPGIFEPSVELEIQIPMTKLGETSIITKSEVESPLDLLDLHNKTFPESSSNTKMERVVESLLNKTGGNLILKRKRKKINRTGFPNVKRKKRKVSEMSLAAENDRKSEGDSKIESVCDRVPHAGETSDTFLERNRTPRLSVVSLERLQGNIKKQVSREDLTPSRTRSTKLSTANRNKKQPIPPETRKVSSTKQLARPLSKKKITVGKEPIKVAVNQHLHITFPTCKIRLKRPLAAGSITNTSLMESLKTDSAKDRANEISKQLPSKRMIGLSKKSDLESVDFLEQEPLPAAFCDIANAIDSESSSSASVLSEDSKSTNRKLKWKKNYLVAGLLSEYYKVNNDNVRGKKIIANQSKENNSEIVLPSSGPLLPPPPYCEKFFRRTEVDFQLPFDIWWAYTNDKLPTRVTVPSWNYRKIRTNVYRCADVRPNTANIDRPTCNCKPDVGCGDDCLNRMVYTECYPSSCPTKEKCQNQKIQRHEVAPGVERFMTENKGWGVRTKLPIKKGTYILEYVGEVVTEKEFKERMATLYSNDTHHYCLHLDGGLVIDGHRMGSDGRFVNHSCSPNCEMQKWSVNGLSRMALFAARNIEAGEEISYDYNFSLFNPSEGQECRCNTPQCRGVIGGKSQRIKPLIDAPKPVDLAAAMSNGRRNGRQRKRQGSARKDVARLQSKDIVMTQLLQQLSEKDKRLIRLQRLFLIRNFEKARRLRSKGVPPTDSSKTEQSYAGAIQRRPSTPTSLAVQINALRSPRNIQTRGLTQAVHDPEVEKMAKMAVIFRDICSALEAIKDDTDKPQIIKLCSNIIKKKGKPPKQLVNNTLKRKTIEFGIIQLNVEKGFYKDPVEFDEDVENLLVSVRDLHKENEEKLEIIKKLSDLYTRKKDEVYDQLVELAADKNSLKNFRPSGFWIEPPVSGVVSKNFSAKSKHTKATTEDIIACICGLFKDEGLMIQCARCMVWQHTECTKADVNADSYLCERCEPRVVNREIPLDEFTEEGYRYYLSLMRGDLQIRQGDTVYVLRDIPIKDEKGNVCPNKKHTYETIGEIDYSECDIFRVERLWKDNTGKRVIFGHHFLRPHETFHEPSRRFYPNEVVRVPLYEVVPIELVIARCWVLDRTTFCKGRPADCLSEEHVFICELRVDKSARFFSKAKVNWPTCTKNYAFKKFDEKLKISKTYAPHDVDPSLLKPRRQKSEATENITMLNPKSTSVLSSKKTTSIRAVRKNKAILPLKTRKQKRNQLEIVLAAIKKFKSKNTQMNESVLDVSYLLSGRGARQRKSIAANVPT